jgi:hypothetical protein
MCSFCIIIAQNFLSDYEDRKKRQMDKILVEIYSSMWSNRSRESLMTHKRFSPVRFDMVFGHFMTLALGVVIAALFFYPDMAFAQNERAKTLGDSINLVYDTLVPLQTFLSVLSYILGVFFSITGLMMLRDHVDDSSRNPISPALLRVAAAAFFIFSPSAINLLVASISGSGGLGDNELLFVQDNVKLVGDFTKGTGLENALGRFVVDIGSPVLDNFLPIFSYVAGVIFMLIGLKRLALANGDGPQAPGGMGTVGTFIVAAALMAFGHFMFILQGSLMGTNILHNNTAMRFTSGSQDLIDRANNTMWAIFTFLRIVGYISVLRGLFMLRAVAEGGNVSMVGVMTHFIAGSLLANGGMMVQMIQCTFVGEEKNFAFAAIEMCP